MSRQLSQLRTDTSRRSGFLVLGVVALAMAPAAARGATFTVNSTADAVDANLADSACDVDTGTGGDQCTLRAAIQESNDQFNPDEIDFGFAGTTVRTITPAAGLPAVSDRVTIDGYTQSGAGANTNPVGQPDNAVIKIEVSGTSAPTASGILFRGGSSGSVIRGLAINRFSHAITTSANTQGDLASLRIEGNFIGTDPGGTIDRGTTSSAIQLFDGPETLIGGASPDARNVISGNLQGFDVQDVDVAIQGNYIGVAADGLTPLGNDLAGVLLRDSHALVGGDPATEGNLIAHNGLDGVDLTLGQTRNTVRGNRIFLNGNLGIDLGINGVTANDPGDADGGSNKGQNFPVVKSAVNAGGNLTLQGKLKSRPDRTYVIELFADDTGGNQGAVYLGKVKVTTNGNGVAKFTRSVPDPGDPGGIGDVATATATDEQGNTSEFSAPLTITAS
jgi:CSLREA domain-containing protein